MSAMSFLGWSTKHVHPDGNGQTVAYVLDERGNRVAVSRTRVTGEEADAWAEEIAAEKVKNMGKIQLTSLQD